MFDTHRVEGIGGCTITCLEVGCNTKIKYSPEDEEVPLYCSKHRTVEGKHAETRKLKRPEPKVQPPPMAVFVCRKCKQRKNIGWGEYMAGEVPECCGKKMVYHKEVKENA